MKCGWSEYAGEYCSEIIDRFTNTFMLINRAARFKNDKTMKEFQSLYAELNEYLQILRRFVPLNSSGWESCGNAPGITPLKVYLDSLSDDNNGIAKNSPDIELLKINVKLAKNPADKAVSNPKRRSKYCLSMPVGIQMILLRVSRSYRQYRLLV